MSDLHVGMSVDGDCANHPDPLRFAISPHDGDKPGRTAGAALLSRGCRVPLVRT